MHFNGDYTLWFLFNIMGSSFKYKTTHVFFLGEKEVLKRRPLDSWHKKKVDVMFSPNQCALVQCPRTLYRMVRAWVSHMLVSVDEWVSKKSSFKMW